MTAVIAVNAEGYKFCGIYEGEEDINRIVLAQTLDSDVICASFNRTVWDDYQTDAAIYASEPHISVYKKTEVTDLS